VAFLSNQNFGIPRSHIETKKVFNLVGIWTILQQFHLQVENLDRIITIVRNCLDDPCVNCIQNKNMKDYLKAKGTLVDDNNELIEEEKYFEKLDVDDE
jgi:hypothetical protein